MTLRTGAAVAVVLVVAFTLGVALPASGAAQDGCRAIDDRQVCVTAFSAPETLVVGGENRTLSVTVENVGSATASPQVVLSTVDPNNETAAFALAVPTLDPGESTTITRPLNASTPGTHGLQVLVLDGASGQSFDSSEPAVVRVRTEPAVGLGGPIDRTEIALAALVLALVGLAGLGYRLR